MPFKFNQNVTETNRSSKIVHKPLTHATTHNTRYPFRSLKTSQKLRVHTVFRLFPCPYILTRSETQCYENLKHNTNTVAFDIVLDVRIFVKKKRTVHTKATGNARRFNYKHDQHLRKLPLILRRHSYTGSYRITED